MDIINLSALLISLAALFSYFNFKFLHMPNAIGVMVVSMLFSLGLISSSFFGFSEIEHYAEDILSSIDFNHTVMHGMLSFLLFAGALHVNLEDLSKHKVIIGVLASVGVVTTTFLVGGASWFLFQALGMEMPLIYCLLFGALIAPTDPVAVLGVLKTLGAPKSLETKIAGESLFNDGVAVVVFLALLGMVAVGHGDGHGHHEVSASGIAMLFAQEAVGGIIFGLVIGYVCYSMLSTVDNYQVEVLLTLALVMGGYSLATALHVSGPIAIVVAGLLIGNHGRMLAMTEKTREHLDTFWELMDEILNALLFMLIGLEVLLIAFNVNVLIAGAILIPVVLVARFSSILLPISIMRKFKEFNPNAVKILTWGGLRGGISVALALSLPAGAERDVILAVTYVVVVFSIVVQGMTIQYLVKSES